VLAARVTDTAVLPARVGASDAGTLIRAEPAVGQVTFVAVA